MFEVDTGHLLLVFPQTLSHELAIDPTGRIVAVAYVDGSIAIWDLHTAALVHRVQTAAQEIFTLAWSPDGALLISGGLRGPITIWDAGSMTACGSCQHRGRFQPDLPSRSTQHCRCRRIAGAGFTLHAGVGRVTPR